MYDQNPLLHKLNIDDLASEYRAQRKMQRNANGMHRFAAIAITLVIVMTAVFVSSPSVV